MTTDPVSPDPSAPEPARPPRRPDPARVRHPLPDVRPLDRFGSLKIKLGVLVVATGVLGVLMTWVGLRNGLGPSRTFPLAIVVSLLLTQVLARGMTSPLRDMTAAARAMAAGDYSRRVRATSHDEVGQLAVAFNKMADDLASSDRTRRDLIANVSHELRTPVAALQAQLENVVDGVVPATPATMQVALDQTERLTRLVTYLLDLSRIEAGAAELTISRIAVGDFLEENAEALSMMEAGKDLRYVVDVAPEDLVLEGDRERLTQVVTNLLHNAIRHSPPNGVIRLEAYPETEDGADVVVLEVVDDGPGIAPQDRERIFERFARGTHAPPPGRATSGGTGIGLAIVRWAVDLHRGRIEVADSEHGATMRVTLPARWDDDDPAVA
ncbi:signal transduction histidine kinase [Sediminihabitans luteus]|uniref:Signal transduction histidine-protein kinase/phosphatase MprB n=1 Tax=Sediminihabitans luteus TaxID=1138585 RepID=A0A2M9CDN3_9CELL|nr:HAMP domain-containing sensor histidine kinase [Sediminihabitans luteus]PJJ70044.1 signal transduction histidine kinase [Sediminihabitans luteus]GIJ00172.1 two-component sensor histidine kinase [Sediminihabitans luteus]